jgi:hypothetical protein
LVIGQPTVTITFAPRTTKRRMFGAQSRAVGERSTLARPLIALAPAVTPIQACWL